MVTKTRRYGGWSVITERMDPGDWVVFIIICFLVLAAIRSCSDADGAEVVVSNSVLSEEGGELCVNRSPTTSRKTQLGMERTDSRSPNVELDACSPPCFSRERSLQCSRLEPHLPACR